MPKVSVIVPCYNAEKWISRGLTSLLDQTFEDVEIIVVNDGSSDNTLQLLCEYQQADSRLKVLNKENGGVSSARNLGLKVAKGEWITFVDIDDEIAVDGITRMLNMISDGVDIVFAGYTTNGKKTQRGDDRTTTLTAHELAMELFHPIDYPYLGNPWAKLYRRSVVEKNNIRFNEAIKYNEDRLFTFTFLSHVKTGAYTTVPVYNYILHEENAMAAIKGPNFWKFETDLDAFLEMCRIAPRYNSREITRLVRLGTIGSYDWNRYLNKEYGNNNKATNRRLKKKLISAVPRGFLFKASCKEYYYNVKSKLYILATKVGIK